MRKMTVGILLFTVMLVCCLCAVACGKDSGSKHTHDLVTVQAKPVTCTEDGWSEYVYCKTEGCGYTTKNVQKALGHDMEETPAQAATCTEDGYTAYGKCKREGCDYATKKTTIHAKGHNIKSVAAQPATCEKDGHSAYKYCATVGCDYEEGKVEYPAVGHILKTVEGDKANCMRTGFDDYEYCERKGCNYSTKNVVKATATEHKLVEGRCSECGFTVNDLADFFVDVPSGKEPVVLQLTDPQIIDSAQDRTNRLGAREKAFYKTPNIKANCYDYITETINAAKPDFILMTGDLVYGEFDDNGTVFNAFVAFMETFKIPWAPVMGNHEGTSAQGYDKYCKILENATYCLFKQRTITGNGNYSVALRQGGEIKRIFYMMDTNGCGDMHENSLVNNHSTSAIGLAEDQIAWIKERAVEFQKYSGAPVSFACHIQPQVFVDALSKYGFPDNVPVSIYSAKNRAEGDFGFLGRGMKGTWDNDKRFYNMMKQYGMDSMFVGHEHNNCASVMYDGVRLQYGQKSSAYDRFNGVNPDTLAIDIGYAPKVEGIVPLVGGTIIPLNIDGTMKTPYIYLCENAGGKIEWNKKILDVNGLKLGDDLTNEGALKTETVEFDGVNAYKITAIQQGKIFVKTGLLANKQKISFSIFLPETSTAKLKGFGEFSVRVKPNELVGSGYVKFSSDLTDETRKIVFGKWKTYEIDISSFGTACTELSILLAQGNVMYLKDVTIS